MNRKDKGRRYRVEAGYGAEITRQPDKPGFSYTYRLACSGCQASTEREGQLDPKSLKGEFIGRYACEFCGWAGTYAIREYQD